MGLISVPSLENSMGFVGLGMSGERFTRTCVGLPHELLDADDICRGMGS